MSVYYYSRPSSSSKSTQFKGAKSLWHLLSHTQTTWRCLWRCTSLNALWTRLMSFRSDHIVNSCTFFCDQIWLILASAFFMFILTRFLFGLSLLLFRLFNCFIILIEFVCFFCSWSVVSSSPTRFHFLCSYLDGGHLLDFFEILNGLYECGTEI